ncbi:hypothetical protein ACFROC_17530 [Nocardia tengchongensis]
MVNLAWLDQADRATRLDFVTDLSLEQEIRILEVLFELLDRFLAERETVD